MVMPETADEARERIAAAHRAAQGALADPAVLTTQFCFRQDHDLCQGKGVMKFGAEDAPSEFRCQCECHTTQVQENHSGWERMGDYPNDGEPTRAGRAGDTQPMPVASGTPIMHRLVQDDLEARLKIGIERYGQPLQAHNGRNALQDAYEEVLDLAVYLRQAIYEQEYPSG